MDLVELGRELEKSAEPGFFESSTHSILSRFFKELGFNLEDFSGMPGFIASASVPGDRPIAVIADMDGLPSGDGYRHLCGHHLQMTALCGAAARLREEANRNPAGNAAETLKDLLFIAAPAEEYIDLERRQGLKEKGLISRLSGKQELLHRGVFQRCRAVVATHAAMLPAEPGVSSVLSMNGFDYLRFEFQGRTAHAGAHPHLGKNAQNAASLFLQACAYLRETFPEKKHVRIHPVMKAKPDQMVNFIPDWAAVETYVRASEPETIETISKRLTAAARGSAISIGVEMIPLRTPGYAPFKVASELHTVLRQTAGDSGCAFEEEDFSSASTDMGDLSQEVPSIIIGLPGTNGEFHNPDFRVIDEDLAYGFSAEILSRYLVDLRIKFI